MVAYKNGMPWATISVRTIGPAVGLRMKTDGAEIAANGEDLSYVTLEIVDAKGDVVRNDCDAVTFSIDGPGEIVAADNGNPADPTPFPSLEK